MSEALTTAFTTGLTAIQTDTVEMVTAALPVALGIAGLTMAIRIGMGFFRSIAH